MVLVLFRFSFVFINIFTYDICTNKKPEHDTVFTVLSVILQGYTGKFNRYRTWKASDTTNKRKLHKRYAAI